MAAKIIEVIYRYQNKRAGSEGIESDIGLLAGLAQAYSHVKANQPIKMCLPAFPFKSPNTKVKVLGRVPDKAEEYALAHLNGLCAAIKDVYSPGAELTIISDGIVYNDLLSVSDLDVWRYGETLRNLAKTKGFSYIRFSRLSDLVPMEVPAILDEVSYVANATNFRIALINNFRSKDWDVNEKITSDEDICLTYRGYLKFLQTDLADTYPISETFTKSKYKKGIESIAKQMLIRGQAFARAVRDKFSNHVRLSIHPSTGHNKVSVSTLPTDSSYTTPWHCAVAVRQDGTITSGLAQTFWDDPTWELVYEDGRPSYFREKSDLYTWSSGAITVNPLYPCGVIISPAEGANKLSMQDIDAQKVRALSEINSPVILRGFSGTKNREKYIEKASEFGTPLPWKFGILLEVKDRGADTRGLNNVLSSEWMPFHFDGLFKTLDHTREDGTVYKLPNPPRFQLFTAVTPSPSDTGFTLFSTSTFVLKHLPASLPLETLKNLTWSVRTTSFESTKLDGLPLIVDHPITGKPCLRYHEPWPENKTSFEATNITIDGQTPEVSDAICRELDGLLHDRRVAYYHAWEKGDMLVSDNILAMHTRSDFQGGAERELWRIHFD
ncbi:Clavaminate synthase-like protein [Trichoderma asperelloides]|nr:Clavaminate synthase-like protein [Trichoderma asperelloides]